MPVQSNYLLFVSMDVDADKEDLFNEVYDEEHIPSVLKVPGVVAATRLKSAPLSMIIGGERKDIVAEGEPTYTALYEIESPDVLLSDAWAEAVEAGRWPSEVRPYTKNRRHVLRKVTHRAG